MNYNLLPFLPSNPALYPQTTSSHLKNLKNLFFVQFSFVQLNLVVFGNILVMELGNFDILAGHGHFS